MVVSHSMGPALELVRARFSTFLLGKLSRQSKLRQMSIFHEIQMAIFWYCLMLQAHGRHAGSPIRTVYVDVTLTRSKVKVKVTGGDDRSPLAWPSGISLLYMYVHCMNSHVLSHTSSVVISVSYCIQQHVQHTTFHRPCSHHLVWPSGSYPLSLAVY